MPESVVRDGLACITAVNPFCAGTPRTAARLALLRLGAVAGLVSLAACGGSDAPAPTAVKPVDTTTTVITPPAPTISPTLATLGLGAVNERYTAEVWVRGTTAYTSTWGTRGGARGNSVKIWDVSGNAPTLVDSVIVASAGTTGDVQVSDDGKLLVVAIESNPNGGLAIYALDTPRPPRLLVRTTGGELQYGVHTAEVARVNGVLYVFCSVDPVNNVPARLVILDLTKPAEPTTVYSTVLGNPFVHDVFVRDGLLFTGEWNNGVQIWDIGAQGGSPSAPRSISRVSTTGGKVHNIWWYQDQSNGEKKYLFVGEEGPGVIGSASIGDVHVVDISKLSEPVEVAAYNLPGAGTHNFSVDETNGLLYAAYYNGGVRVIDVRGDLRTCTAAQKFSDGRCNLGLMGREKAKFLGGNGGTYVWGVYWTPTAMYASDMLFGLWKTAPAVR